MLSAFYKALSNVKTINELPYIKFVEKVSGELMAELPQTIPLTSNAAKYHGWRVFIKKNNLLLTLSSYISRGNTPTKIVRFL